MLRMCSCAEGAKSFAIFFENSLVVRTSQQSLVKWVWAFSQSVAAPTVNHPGARGSVSILKRSGFGPVRKLSSPALEKHWSNTGLKLM